MTSIPGSDRDHPSQAAPRVARNTLYLAAADVANKVMVFVFFAIAARHLGAEKFGTFSLALAFATMFSVLADLGLGFYSAREIARNPAVASQHLGNALAIKFIASLVSAGFIYVVARLIGYPGETVSVVMVMSLFVLTNAVSLYYAAVFQGFERMELTAVSRAVQTVVLVVGALVLSRTRPSTVNFAWLYVVAGMAGVAAAGVAFSTVLHGPRISLEWKSWPGLIRSAFPFGLAAVFVILYYWNGTALLSRLRGDEQVGFYSAAFRLVLGVGFLSFAFSGAMYPVLSRLHGGDTGRLRSSISASLRYVMIAAIPLGVIGSVVAKPIVEYVYGPQFGAAAHILRVLVWWGGLASINSMLSNYLYAVERPRLVVVQSVLGLGVSVGLNLALIPHLGGLGLAFSILAAELCGTCVLAFAQWRTSARVDTKSLATTAVKCAVAAAAAALVAWLVIARMHVLAALAIGLALYAGLMVPLRVAVKADLAMLQRILRRD